MRPVQQFYAMRMFAFTNLDLMRQVDACPVSIWHRVYLFLLAFQNDQLIASCKLQHPDS